MGPRTLGHSKSHAHVRLPTWTNHNRSLKDTCWIRSGYVILPATYSFYSPSFIYTLPISQEATCNFANTLLHIAKQNLATLEKMSPEKVNHLPESDTKLTLGLPGGGGGECHRTKAGTKRGFLETVDLNLMSSSNDNKHCEENDAMASTTTPATK